jgi:RNA polymerase sigma-70 factor (ECF subfamily)
MLVSRLSASLIAARKAAKRGSGRRPLSLDQPLSDRKGDRFDGVLSITKEDQDNRKGRRSLSAEELIDLSYDMAAVMRELPPDLLEVANRLKRQSAAEAAREMGIPRSTFYELIKRLTRRGKRSQLDKYLRP